MAHSKQQLEAEEEQRLDEQDARNNPLRAQQLELARETKKRRLAALRTVERHTEVELQNLREDAARKAADFEVEASRFTTVSESNATQSQPEASAPLPASHMLPKGFQGLGESSRKTVALANAIAGHALSSIELSEARRNKRKDEAEKHAKMLEYRRSIVESIDVTGKDFEESRRKLSLSLPARSSSIVALDGGPSQRLPSKRSATGSRGQIEDDDDELFNTVDMSSATRASKETLGDKLIASVPASALRTQGKTSDGASSDDDGDSVV